MAVKIIRQIPKAKNCKIVITRGTPYHVSSSDGEDWENVIAERVGATVTDHAWVEIEDVIFDLKHHPAGSGSLPHTRHGGVAKDRLWNVLLS
jgi:ribosome biogenesis protein Tsr3